MKALAGAAMVLGVGMWGGAAVAGPDDYDGRWTVRMVTDSGSVCDKSYNYVIAVEDGRVRYIPHDTDAAPAVSGSVSPAGTVALGIRKGLAQGNVSGQLRGGAGSGTWQAAGLCTGRWTASKRGPVTASRS
jgi:hypothetical protein